jgi:hypothetical protein
MLEAIRRSSKSGRAGCGVEVIASQAPANPSQRLLGRRTNFLE